MQDFRKRRVWKRSHQLVLDVYKATSSFPGTEQYGLTGQVRRASISISSNIAEGCGRSTDADFAHFLTIAMGSAREVDYQLLLAHDLGLLEHGTYQKLLDEISTVRRMLNAFIQKLKANSQ